MRAKYYPIVVKIDDRQFYIEDVRAWVNGDFSSITGLEKQVLVVLAQAALAWAENWEREHKDDLIAAHPDVATITGLHLEFRDVREKAAELAFLAGVAVRTIEEAASRIRSHDHDNY